MWCTSDDVVYANRSLLCVHTASGGSKAVELPAPALLTDLWSGEQTPTPTRRLEFASPPYRTRAWRTQYTAESSG